MQHFTRRSNSLPEFPGLLPHLSFCSLLLYALPPSEHAGCAPQVQPGDFSSLRLHGRWLVGSSVPLWVSMKHGIHQAFCISLLLTFWIFRGPQSWHSTQHLLSPSPFLPLPTHCQIQQGTAGWCDKPHLSLCRSSFYPSRNGILVWRQAFPRRNSCASG